MYIYIVGLMRKISTFFDGFLVMHFQCNNSAIDIWADSVSLQPFTQEEWKSHQDLSIEKVKKQN